VTAAPRVAVVVVTYNSATVLPGLVASLPAGMAGTTWQLVIVDNASADDTLDVARSVAPDALVLATGRNDGYAAGINAGVEVAEPHDAVLVLNPDVRLRPGAGSVLAATCADPGTGIAVPRLVDGEDRLILSLRREPTLLRAWADALIGAERAGRIGRLGEVVSVAQTYAHPQQTDWAEGSTVMVSAECWRRCGPWDEEFFLYSEETEYALRARDHGLVTWFVPTAEAVHLEGDSRVSPGLWMLLVLNRLRLYRRRHGSAASAAYWAALVVREGSRAALGREPNQRAVRALLRPSMVRARPGPDLVASGVSGGA
jgi:N-acetylglucosaminyl-diphospho-decaprenol L-rhamnosyltransferase